MAMPLTLNSWHCTFAGTETSSSTSDGGVSCFIRLREKEMTAVSLLVFHCSDCECGAGYQVVDQSGMNWPRGETIFQDGIMDKTGRWHMLNAQILGG